MLEKLLLTNVGPAEKIDLIFTSRLNLLTGNNSLGKTFVLDIAWWVLTHNWAGLPARPRQHKFKNVSENNAHHTSVIKYTIKNTTSFTTEIITQFDPKKQCWKINNGKPQTTNLVLYARVDGGFSVWDTARNRDTEISNAFHFSNQMIWNGLSEGINIISNGLLRDWLRWQSRETEIFKILTTVLAELSPPEEIIQPGEKTVRLSLNDVRDIPTVQLSYGDVPLLHISAGMRRIIELAYMMVWAWSEHLKASELLEEQPSHSMVLLLDEAEAHLHPQWQRCILPALLKVVHYLHKDMAVQVIAGTHAPLVLASIEPDFNPKMDKLFHFYLNKQQIEVEEMPWVKYGDATGWLISDVFGLKQARSLEAEKAIESATTL